MVPHYVGIVVACDAFDAWWGGPAHWVRPRWTRLETLLPLRFVLISVAQRLTVRLMMERLALVVALSRCMTCRLPNSSESPNFIENELLYTAVLCPLRNYEPVVFLARIVSSWL